MLMMKECVDFVDRKRERERETEREREKTEREREREKMIIEEVRKSALPTTHRRQANT